MNGICALLTSWCIVGCLLASPALSDGPHAPVYPDIPTVLLHHEVAPFRSRLGPLQEVTRDGFGGEFGARLDAPFRMSSEWEARATKESTEPIAQDSLAIRGPYFSTSAIEADIDPISRGRRILWNVHSHLRSRRNVATKFSLIWGDSWDRASRASFHFERSYQFEEERERQPIQYFRERMFAVQPTALHALGWLSFRFLDSEEDMFWIRSPSLRVVRQLTGTNRGDSLLGSLISMNDLFLWSGNPERYHAHQRRKAEYVVPFISAPPSALSSLSSSCLQVSLPSSGGVWNGSSGRFPDVAEWVPTSVRFVPREIYDLDLRDRDPFAAGGRVRLLVDAATFLPLEKAVYNEKGDLLRVGVALWTRGESFDRTITFPILQGMFIVEPASGSEISQSKFSLVTHESYRFCSTTGETSARKDFDPSFFFETPLRVD